MLFTTGVFLFAYLPVTLAVFFVSARLFGPAVAAAWLGLASLFFYGYWLPSYTLLLVASIAVNYVFGSLILRSQGGARRGWLIAAVTVNLGVLAYFKYANFLLQTANDLGGADFPTLAIILPLGISFFTFTQIAYLADVHAGKVVERNPIHYLLFVTYFPHLIAGPVLHHSEMMPQFKRPEIYRPHVENFVAGLAFLALGLAKKILIADSLAPTANDAFDRARPADLGSAHAWLGVSAYSFQLYFDFSGYSDMAVGLSLLVGVQLPYNFDSPYQASSIIDFWRRWHMTLSRFLRDYLYFALGGNRKGRVRRYVNLMLTMLLGGLWHGASWTFVVWGGLHGLYLIVNHAWRFLAGRIAAAWAGWKSLAASSFSRFLAVALTLICVLIAWVFFRAKTVEIAFAVVGAMFHRSPGTHMSGADWRLLPWIAALTLVVIALPNSQQLIARLRARLPALAARAAGRHWMAFAAGVEVVAIVMLALIAARRASTEFIYFNF